MVPLWMQKLGKERAFLTKFSWLGILFKRSHIIVAWGNPTYSTGEVVRKQALSTQAEVGLHCVCGDRETKKNLRLLAMIAPYWNLKVFAARKPRSRMVATKHSAFEDVI